jgi:hypothetical protein
MSNNASRERARLRRLSPLTQGLINNRAAALELLAIAPFLRLMFANGFSPEPDLGLPEFDAMIAIFKDALGIAPLSDEDFEHALRLSTPPECREPLQ